MQITPHQPEDLEQLRQRSRQQRDAKPRDRYHAVVLALEGHGAPDIAQTLARSRRCVPLARLRGFGGFWICFGAAIPAGGVMRADR